MAYMNSEFEYVYQQSTIYNSTELIFPFIKWKNCSQFLLSEHRNYIKTTNLFCLIFNQKTIVVN